MTQWLVTELALLTIGVLDSARKQSSQEKLKWTNIQVCQNIMRFGEIKFTTKQYGYFQ